MPQPGLAMLWETTDATGALERRFGFPDAASAGVWCGDVLREVWGIAASVDRIVISAVNAIVWAGSDRGPLVVKVSCAEQLFARLESSTRISEELGARGVPVAAPLASVDGRLRAVLEGPSGALSVAVLPEIEGTWLDVRDLDAVHDAGAALARLHAALAELGDPGRAPANRLRDRIETWLQDRDPGLAPDASRRLADLVGRLPDLPGATQPVHDDYRAANILTRDGDVVAILDFDEVRVAHPVEDLAKASVYLGTLFRDWQPTAPATRAALRSGYESAHPLTSEESAWLDALTLWQAIMAIPADDASGVWADAARMPLWAPSS